MLPRTGRILRQPPPSFYLSSFGRGRALQIYFWCKDDIILASCGGGLLKYRGRFVSYDLIKDD